MPTTNQKQHTGYRFPLKNILLSILLSSGAATLTACSGSSDDSSRLLANPDGSRETPTTDQPSGESPGENPEDNSEDSPVESPDAPPMATPDEPPVENPSMPPIEGPNIPPIAPPGEPTEENPGVPPIEEPSAPPVEAPSEPPVAPPSEPPIGEPEGPPVEPLALLRPNITEFRGEGGQLSVTWSESNASEYRFIYTDTDGEISDTVTSSLTAQSQAELPAGEYSLLVEAYDHLGNSIFNEATVVEVTP